MTLQEFYEYLNTQIVEDKIVYMRYKYSWEDEWTYTNEILEVDMSVEGYYIWATDWNEGQEEVEILGCISVSDIDVPEFEIPGKSTLEQEPTTKNDLGVDAVSRKEVINQIFYSTDNNGDVVLGSELRRRIERIPSVTPQEPKTGHWIADVDKWGDVVTTVNGYRCDKCNAFNSDKDNYCPNCGAKMGVEDGKNN